MGVNLDFRKMEIVGIACLSKLEVKTILLTLLLLLQPFYVGLASRQYVQVLQNKMPQRIFKYVPPIGMV